MIKRIIKIPIFITLFLTVSVTLLLVLSTSKITHKSSHTYVVEDLNILDQTFVEKGVMAVGKNLLGPIEAIIYPIDSDMEYIYLRFDPISYYREIKPHITEHVQMDMERVKNIHKTNFHDISHIGDNPLVIPDLLVGQIKREGSSKKEYLFPTKLTKIQPDLKFKEALKSWNSREYKYLRLHYPDNLIVKNTIDKWAAEREGVFEILLEEFGAEWSIDEKVDIYIFNDHKHGEKFGFQLGFANPETKEIYTRYDQTKGHEIAHVISHYINDRKRISSSLINEGLATYYDASGRDYHEITYHILSQEDFSIDIFGANFRKHPQAYSLGASFVSFLIETYGKDLFWEFFAQNSYGEAEAFKFYYRKSNQELYNDWILYLKS